MIRRLSLSTLALSAALLSSPPAWSQVSFSSEYDDTIKSAVKRYWVTFDDWLYWKAQLYQESRFDPKAKSQVGAEGIAQFMPKTWVDITHQLGWSGISAHQAGPAIEAGAYYMEKLRRTWSGPRTEHQRHQLAVGSYNAGAGSLLRAQGLCRGSTTFAQLAPCLPAVTGSQNAAQTVTYVERIDRWRAQLGR